MRIKSALAAIIIPMALVFTACGAAQDGCYDDGERVSCGYEDDDDREWDDDEEWDD